MPKLPAVPTLAPVGDASTNTHVAPDLGPLIRPLAGLHEDPVNARAHPERNLDAIKVSLSTFGQQKPIVVARDGTVVAGNGTLAAACALGWTELACVTTDLDADAARAFAIADNRTAELAEWDIVQLAETLKSLPESFAGLVGFDEREFARIARDADAAIRAAQGQADADDVPEPPVVPVTKSGDLWILGSHRLLCGDSTKPEDVARLMNGETASLAASDPPYLVDYDANNHPQSFSNRPEVRDKNWDEYKDPESGVAFFEAYAFGQEFEAAFLTPGGGIFRPEWLHSRWTRDGTSYVLTPASGPPAIVPGDGLVTFATVDLAASLRTTADYSVVMVFGKTTGNRLLVLDVDRARREGPDLVPTMQRAVKAWKCRAVYIEKVGFQLALVQDARRQGLPVRELEADRDKVARALPATAALEGGLVFLPREARWLRDFESELLAFPNGQFDDQVDAFAYGVAAARGLSTGPSIWERCGAGPDDEPRPAPQDDWGWVSDKQFSAAWRRMLDR